uniref:Metallothionein-like protein n=1 Tax=Tanacetum cinerariifolium TaxID=118510 RepID=A0A6L2P0X6_TANCI|nr:ribonuclease H-like domain-containing protein [Tanacetum cinerariifolium]
MQIQLENVSCSNGKYNCGSSCSCCNSCNVEKSTATMMIIDGVAPKMAFADGSETLVAESGNGYKCGSSCNENNCTIEFDVFGFSVKDFMTRRVLLRCDSTGDLYPVTAPSLILHVFLVSQHTWHQRLGHPGREVLRHLVSNNFISSNKEKPHVLCHARQISKHVRLPFFSSNTVVTFCFEIIHSDQIIWSLHQDFTMTDLGPLNYFLGISVTRDFSGLFLPYKKYAVEILEKAHMVTCNPCRTPIDTESKLSADGDPVSDPTLYRSLVGPLQYLTFTRPDISYAVQQVCLYMHDLREPYFSALKRIPRYVQGTLDYGFKLFSSSTTDLVAYFDADWAGSPTTRRSTSEAEYRGVANAVAETCWLRSLLRELHRSLSFATLVYCDNVSAVYLSCNPVQHQRTKHINIDIHFVRDLVADGQNHLLLVYIVSYDEGMNETLSLTYSFKLLIHVKKSGGGAAVVVMVLLWLCCYGCGGGAVVVVLWWCCGEVVVVLWWSCGGGVVVWWWCGATVVGVIW